MRHVIKRRWGLPGGHLSKGFPPLDQEVFKRAIVLLGDAAQGDIEYLTDRIEIIVGLHRALQELETDPPRTADIETNLSFIMESANELRSLIAALDYLSLRELRRHGAFQHPSLIVPIADNQPSVDEYKAIQEGRGSRILSMLDDIEQASEHALEALPTDLGGSIKQPMLGSPANDELVAFCYQLFNKYRPGEARTTQGKPFRTFVSLVVELSTGKESDLENAVKDYLGWIKQNPEN